MDFIDKISSDVDSVLKPLFTDKVSGAVLSLIIVLYAGLAAPKLPKVVSNLFKSKIFKLIILIIIAYTASKNSSIAIITAVALVVSMQTLSKQEQTEKVVQEIEDAHKHEESTEVQSETPVIHEEVHHPHALEEPHAHNEEENIKMLEPEEEMQEAHAHSDHKQEMHEAHDHSKHMHEIEKTELPEAKNEEQTEIDTHSFYSVMPLDYPVQYQSIEGFSNMASIKDARERLVPPATRDTPAPTGTDSLTSAYEEIGGCAGTQEGCNVNENPIESAEEIMSVKVILESKYSITTVSDREIANYINITKIEDPEKLAKFIAVNNELLNYMPQETVTKESETILKNLEDPLDEITQKIIGVSGAA